MSGSGGNAYIDQMRGFNVFGKPTGETITIPASENGLSGSYTFTHTYSANTGLPDEDIYPPKGNLPSETVVYGYSTALDVPNDLSSTYSYTSGTTWDAFGRVTQTELGTHTADHAYITNTFDDHTGALKDTQLANTAVSSTPIDDTSYNYDPAGNPTSQTETRQGNATETQCFGYDTLDRLVQAWTATDACQTDPASNNGATVGSGISGGAYWTSWDLDPLGQRKTQTEHNLTGPGDTVTTYTYDGNAAGQPHTLTKTSTTGPSGTTTSTYSYNATGDTTQRSAGQGQQSLTWDDAGNLTAVTGGTNGDSNYIYDADGNLLLQKDPGTTTLYLPGEQLALDTGTGQITGTRFYALPGGGEAVRTGTGSAYTFETGDQHNTATLTIDNTFTTPTWRQQTPYGAPRGQAPLSWPDNHGFLNKPEDTSTGLTDIGARWYDPNTGTFASLDPLFEATDTQQQGGYNYAASNPITNSDPSGLRADECGAGGHATACDKSYGHASYSDYYSTGGYVYDPPGHGVGGIQNFTGQRVAKHRAELLAAAIAQDKAEAKHLAMLEKIEQSRKPCHGFWGCVGHDVHGVFNTAGALSPFATALAIGTSWIPGVDVVTAAVALGIDALATAGSAWNVVTDFTDQGWGAFKSLNLYLDVGGVALGSLGFGTSVRSIVRASEKRGAKKTIDGLRERAAKKRSGNPAVRADAASAKDQLPAAKARLRVAKIGEGYANSEDQVVNSIGAWEAAETNSYENSLNPLAVAFHYSWAMP